ncbi:MAG: argininosuccinate lyase [Fibrobacterota bacterium]
MKLWEGRFKEGTDALMEEFNNSLPFDRELFHEDIEASTAWASALARAGILKKEEAASIKKALKDACIKMEKGVFRFHKSDEDIHTALERYVTEQTKGTGAKLHTGRSRNDQVSVDIRIYVKKACLQTIKNITALQKVLVEKASKHIDTIMPGYTHLQQAQPVLFSHYLMSLFFMLKRDAARFSNCMDNCDEMPLGSAAFAGSAYPVDREFLRKELGFRSISDNSIDAVSDRDFIIEYLSSSAILITHLSRFAEDFTIWSSSEFGYIELSDAYSTGSSIMPQKKNPDSLELLRGKCGRIFGSLFSLLTVMKGLPLTYSKDMQEDKEPLFDTIKTVNISLKIFAGLLETAEIRKDKMEQNLTGMLLATEIADYMAKRGIPFRESHAVTGKIVRKSVETGKDLRDFSLEDFKKVDNRFSDDIKSAVDFKNALKNRSLPGGTAKSSVRNQIRLAKAVIRKSEKKYG